MTNFIMAMGPNHILLGATIMALAIVLVAFHKQILRALGIRVPKRRRRSRKRARSIVLDIAKDSPKDN